MFAGVMTGLEELRRDMTTEFGRVEERAHQGQEKLRDELTNVKSQAKVDRAQLIHNTYAHTMTSLEKKLDARSDLMMRKLDVIINGRNREERSNPKEHLRQENDRDGARSQVRDRIINLIIGRDPGQPNRCQVGQTRYRRSGCHPGDTIAHSATSQIVARSDYSVAGHNDVCLDV